MGNIFDNAMKFLYGGFPETNPMANDDGIDQFDVYSCDLNEQQRVWMDEAHLNEYKEKVWTYGDQKVPYESYRFFYEDVLRPACHHIKYGECKLNIYLIHHAMDDFMKWCREVADIENVALCQLDCRKLTDVSDVFNFIDRLPQRALLVLIHPSMLSSLQHADLVDDLLYYCWADPYVDIEEIFKRHHALSLLSPDYSKILKRKNFGIIYADVYSSKFLPSCYRGITYRYGNFELAFANTKFMKWCLEQKSVDFNSLIKRGKEIF